MNKKWMYGIGLLLGLSLVTGCGNSGSSSDSSDSETSEGNSQELTVALWNYDSAPEFQLLIKEFEEKENVTVKPVDIAAADYETKLTTMLASGDKTDVLAMKSLASYSMYAYKDQLVDLSDHVNDTLDAENYNGVLEELTTDDGKIYAQPYRNDFYLLLYNKDLFDAVGEAYPDNLTWDEYEALAKKMSDPSNQIYGSYHHYWYMLTLSLAAAQEGKDLLDPSYEYALPQYERFVRMQEDESVLPFGTAKSTKMTYNSQFESGKTAMMPMGTWYLTSLLYSLNAGTTDVNWGLSEIPQNEKGTDITTMGHSTSFAINKNSENKELAQKFLDFVSSKEAALELAKIGVSPAYVDDEVRAAYFAVEGMPTDEVSQKAYNPDKIGRELPLDEFTSTYDKIFNEENELIMVGDNTPEKGVAELESRIKDEVGN